MVSYQIRNQEIHRLTTFLQAIAPYCEKIERLESYGVNHLSAITFCVRSVNEFKEQVHFFAEEVMQPYRHAHEKFIETVNE